MEAGSAFVLTFAIKTRGLKQKLTICLFIILQLAIWVGLSWAVVLFYVMSVGVSHECAVRFAGASGWLAGLPPSMCFLYMMCYPPGLFARWQYFRRTRTKLEAKA